MCSGNEAEHALPRICVCFLCWDPRTVKDDNNAPERTGLCPAPPPIHSFVHKIPECRRGVCPALDPRERSIAYGHTVTKFEFEYMVSRLCKESRRQQTPAMVDQRSFDGLIARFVAPREHDIPQDTIRLSNHTHPSLNERDLLYAVVVQPAADALWESLPSFIT